MAAYRYYLPYRMPEPGAVPDSANVINCECYPRKQYVQRVGEVYGWVEYEYPLTEKQINDYELVEATIPYMIFFPGGDMYTIYTTDKNAKEMKEKHGLAIDRITGETDEII